MPSWALSLRTQTRGAATAPPGPEGRLRAPCARARGAGR
ncbi:MAG: hypothetical protein RL071_527, partial [Pseudomonadota bacterium]